MIKSLFAFSGCRALCARVSDVLDGALGPEKSGVKAVATVLLCTTAILVGACARGAPSGSIGSTRPAAYDPLTGTSASPRVVAGSQQVPKGGGTYKVGNPYKITGRWYVPREEPGYDRTGIASWYGEDFHGRKTANGEIFDMNALTAAHPTLPLPSYVYVTNLDNNRTVLVRVNDRGPYAHDRIIDMSRRSARELGFEGRGLTNVRVRYAGRAPLDGNDQRERQHLAAQPWSGGGGSFAADTPRGPTPPAPVRQAADSHASDTWTVMGHRGAAPYRGSRPMMLGVPE